MTDHRQSKQAEKILALQRADGSWGCFHSLSRGAVCTTEQAIRRLMILGYTLEDDCLRRVEIYLEDCLEKGEIPDRREKTHNWDIFVRMMLASWLRRLGADSAAAKDIARKWAAVLTGAFHNGQYAQEEYNAVFQHVFGEKPRGGRLLDFVQPYILTLVNGFLDEETESRMFSYVLNHELGMYYIYSAKLSEPPRVFQSRQANWYLSAVELMALYPRQREKLRFVRDWLYANQNERGGWDLGSLAKDGVNFPLSNDWRKKGAREADCTERILNLLRLLEA